LALTALLACLAWPGVPLLCGHHAPATTTSPAGSALTPPACPLAPCTPRPAPPRRAPPAACGTCAPALWLAL
jgi:hypothetical protein